MVQGAGPVSELSWLMQLGQLGASSAIIVMFGWTLWKLSLHFKDERESRDRVADAYRRAASRYRKAGVALAEAHREAAIAAAAAHKESSVAAIAAALEAAEKRDKYERESCEKQHKELMELIERRHEEAARERSDSHKVIRTINHEIANLAQWEANKKALEKVKRDGIGRVAGQTHGEAGP